MGIRPDDWASLDHRGLPDKINRSHLYVDELGYLRSKRKDYKTVATEDIYRVPILRDSHIAINLFNQYSKLKGVSKDFGQVFDSHIFQETDEKFDVKEKIFLRLIEGMNEFATQENIKFIIIMIPFNVELEPELIPKAFPHKIYKGIKLEIKRDYYAELEQKVNKMRINSINLLNKMKQSPEKNYFPRNGEGHFNPNGHLFTAKCIDDFLLKNRLLDTGNTQAVPLSQRH